MDKYNFYKLVAQERQHEISKELATRHLLKEAEGDTPEKRKPKPMVLRIAPAFILITLILLYFL